MYYLLYNFKNDINKDGILVNNQIIKFTKKRNIFSDRKNSYIMIEIFESDNIKDYIVYDENIQYQNFLYKEIICLNLKKSKFTKSSIIGFNDKKHLRFHPLNGSGYKNDYSSNIKIDDKIFTSTIFLLNDKEKEYPIIDSFDTDFNSIIKDMKKRLIFTSKIKKIPKTDNKLFKSLGMNIDSLNVLKDGRITISSKGNFYIYSNDFSEKQKISLHGHLQFKYHGVLKNGNILAYYFSPLFLD